MPVRKSYLELLYGGELAMERLIITSYQGVKNAGLLKKSQAFSE